MKTLKVVLLLNAYLLSNDTKSLCFLNSETNIILKSIIRSIAKGNAEFACQNK
jgi:hypothetical protein